MRALVFSMWASVVFVVVSLAWGLAAGSQMIVFDGLYSLVGIALSAVSVAAQRTVAKGADASYPWGRETWEPVVIVVRSTALGGLCVYGSVNAVREILHGGRAVSAVSALAYAITASLLSVLVALVLWRAARSGSGLVRAEAAEWGGDAAFSLVTLAGFGAAVALESAGRGDIARYVDPTLVIIVSLAYLWIPIRLFRSAFREILTMAAPRSVVTDVERLCDRVRTTPRLRRILRSRLHRGQPPRSGTRLRPRSPDAGTHRRILRRHPRRYRRPAQRPELPPLDIGGLHRGSPLGGVGSDVNDVAGPTVSA
ncbi:cation transporter [Nocardia nova]|uniref:cation transporter n=1 Tax=Nocardia nova TaxID=37330 RepID=UPI000CEA56FE|nr:cation transporter [Nocardia nova]PPJ06248.1 cation transporter [Nocardia nova]